MRMIDSDLSRTLFTTRFMPTTGRFWRRRICLPASRALLMKKLLLPWRASKWKWAVRRQGRCRRDWRWQWSYGSSRRGKRGCGRNDYSVVERSVVPVRSLEKIFFTPNILPIHIHVDMCTLWYNRTSSNSFCSRMFINLVYIKPPRLPKLVYQNMVYQNGLPKTPGGCLPKLVYQNHLPRLVFTMDNKKLEKFQDDTQIRKKTWKVSRWHPDLYKAGRIKSFTGTMHLATCKPEKITTYVWCRCYF